MCRSQNFSIFAAKQKIEWQAVVEQIPLNVRPVFVEFEDLQARKRDSTMRRVFEQNLCGSVVREHRNLLGASESWTCGGQSFELQRTRPS